QAVRASRAYKHESIEFSRVAECGLCSIRFGPLLLFADIRRLDGLLLHNRRTAIRATRMDAKVCAKPMPRRNGCCIAAAFF
ncbi:MAG: hypothetical protein ACK55W_13715, partial [Pseudomonadota bacterium]